MTTIKQVRAAAQNASGDKFCMNCKTHKKLAMFTKHKQKCDSCMARIKIARTLP